MRLPVIRRASHTADERRPALHTLNIHQSVGVGEDASLGDGRLPGMVEISWFELDLDDVAALRNDDDDDDDENSFVPPLWDDGRKGTYLMVVVRPDDEAFAPTHVLDIDRNDITGLGWVARSFLGIYKGREKMVYNNVLGHNCLLQS